MCRPFDVAPSRYEDVRRSRYQKGLLVWIFLGSVAILYGAEEVYFRAASYYLVEVDRQSESPRRSLVNADDKDAEYYYGNRVGLYDDTPPSSKSRNSTNANYNGTNFTTNATAPSETLGAIRDG